MRRIKGARVSPGLLVAVVALVAALAGTAVGGVALTSLNKGEKKVVKRIAKKQGKRQANKQINKKAPGLSVANADRLRGNAPGELAVGSATIAANAGLLGGRTAADLETPSAYTERTSDANLTDQFQPVLDASLTTGGKRIIATVSLDVFGGTAAAEVACRVAIGSETSSDFDQDIPLVGANSDATMSFSFAATVGAGTHDVDLACREEEGSVEIIFASIAAVAVDD